MAKLTIAEIEALSATSTDKAPKSAAGSVSSPEDRANNIMRKVAQKWLESSHGKPFKVVRHAESTATLHSSHMGTRTREYVLVENVLGEKFISGPAEWLKYGQYPGSFVPYSAKGAPRKARVNVDGSAFVPGKIVPASTVSASTDLVPVETRKLASTK